MVGQVMLQVLKEMGFSGAELVPVASAQSVGKEILWNGKKVAIVSMEDAIALKPAIAIFLLEEQLPQNLHQSLHLQGVL